MTDGYILSGLLLIRLEVVYSKFLINSEIVFLKWSFLVVVVVVVVIRLHSMVVHAGIGAL